MSAAVAGRHCKHIQCGVDGEPSQFLVDRPGRQERTHQQRPREQVTDPVGIEAGARFATLDRSLSTDSGGSVRTTM
jgi:hypothetical protein